MIYFKESRHGAGELAQRIGAVDALVEEVQFPTPISGGS